MNSEEHNDIHLNKDIYHFLKLLIQNATKYPHEVSKSAIELKLRMDEQHKIYEKTNKDN